MRHLTMTVKEDTASGEVGLLLDDVRQIDTFMTTQEGYIIAHDILEHQNGLKSIGSVDDELEALGGVWYIRGQFSDLSRTGMGSMYSPEESIGSDVANLGGIFVERGVNFRTPVPRTRISEEEDGLQEILESGMKTLMAELHYNDEPLDYARIGEYRTAAMHYLRRGVTKAKKRFGCAHKANRMFWNIAEAVNPCAKYLEFQGQRFRLSYDANSARCSEIHDDWGMY